MTPLQKVIVEQIRERNTYRRARRASNEVLGLAGTQKRKWPNAMTDIERLLAVIDEMDKSEKLPCE